MTSENDRDRHSGTTQACKRNSLSRLKSGTIAQRSLVRKEEPRTSPVERKLSSSTDEDRRNSGDIRPILPKEQRMTIATSSKQRQSIHRPCCPRMWHAR